LKEDALDCAPWRSHFGRGYGPVTRQKIRSTGSKVEKMHESTSTHTSIMAISKAYFFTLKKESWLKKEYISIKNSQ